jgi:DNA-directed RNA polymerase specialized sigma24 family protein
VLQETYAYLARKFPGFVLTAALTTFLYPAVRNFSLAVRRKRRRATGNDDLLPLIAEASTATATQSELERDD